MHTRQITLLALFAAVGIVLFVLESFIPIPFPFLKIGLANVSSVIALMIVSTSGMMIVVVTRVVVGSLLVGTFLGPGFVLAFSAGVISALTMALVRKLTGKLFSVIGISLVGSVTHVLVQFLLVLFVYVQSTSVSYLLPLLLFSALFGGLVVGWISAKLLDALKRISVR